MACLEIDVIERRAIIRYRWSPHRRRRQHRWQRIIVFIAYRAASRPEVSLVSRQPAALRYSAARGDIHFARSMFVSFDTADVVSRVVGMLPKSASTPHRRHVGLRAMKAGHLVKRA